MFEPSAVEFSFTGNRDPEGRFDGYAVLDFAVDKETCFRGKCGKPAFRRLAGHFVEGQLQGPVTLTSTDFKRTVAVVANDEGVAHSLLVATINEKNTTDLIVRYSALRL